MKNSKASKNILLQSLENISLSGIQPKLSDREVIIKNFLQLFKCMPEFIEEKSLSYTSISEIIRIYCWIVIAINKMGYNDENEYINHPEWIKIRDFAQGAFLLIKQVPIEKITIEVEDFNSKERDSQEYLFKIFLLNLQMLGLPYEEQKLFYPPIADILEEVIWDFEFSFETLPQLIEREYLNYDAIAWSIRTYLQLEDCVENVGYDDEDLYENSLEWNEVRKVANKTLTFMKPLKYELKDVTSW